MAYIPIMVYFPTIGYNYGEITHNNTISSNNPLNGGEKPFMIICGLYKSNYYGKLW